MKLNVTGMGCGLFYFCLKCAFFWVTSSGFACVDSEFGGGGHSDRALTLCTPVLCLRHGKLKKKKKKIISSFAHETNRNADQRGSESCCCWLRKLMFVVLLVNCVLLIQSSVRLAIHVVAACSRC